MWQNNVLYHLYDGYVDNIFLWGKLEVQIDKKNSNEIVASITVKLCHLSLNKGIILL